jgi:SAM-dependent methyltransferase
MTWYEQSFGRDYLVVYKHRNFQSAHQEVKSIIEWLDLPPGAEILDLCCGIGRHSLKMAELGYHVTGVDLSETLLTEAKKLDAASKITWVRADMRRIPLIRTYDAIVNLFTSFGYFESDRDNMKVLLEIERLLRPGGKWIIDYLNPDHVISHLVPFSERMEENMLIQEARCIEDGVVRKHITIREPNRPERHYREQVKLYKPSDFERMVKSANLQIDKIFGDYTGSSYTSETSARIILVGHKPLANLKNLT